MGRSPGRIARLFGRADRRGPPFAEGSAVRGVPYISRPGDAAMRWRGRRGSTNVEDRRGAGGGGGGLVVGGGAGVVILLLAVLLGVDPRAVLDTAPADRPAGAATTAAEDSAARFVEVVLADTEEVWGDLFPSSFGEPYREPTLVLFSGSVRSGCGMAGSVVGPFYCPLNGQVYLDLSFFDDLERRLGAEGEFARAYVIAHEVGHHVQNLLGIFDAAGGANRSNDASVRLELQADCLAGVWARNADQRWSILEPGDVEAAMGAAAAVGDDRIQRRGQGEVVPETFTHGSSAQRQGWFMNGFESGDPGVCDTFSTDRL